MSLPDALVLALLGANLGGHWVLRGREVRIDPSLAAIETAGLLGLLWWAGLFD